MPTYHNGDWFVTSPSGKTSCYYYKVGHRGEKRHAYLTYRLTGPGAPARDLLMVQRDSKARLFHFLDDKDRARLQWIEQHILSRRSSRGAVSTAKNLVNEIYRDQAPLENMVVAVHKLGPVPVYLLPANVEIELGDREPPRIVQACIGVYQDVTAVGERTWPPVFLDRREFLESLGRDLPTIFLKYFEDVCETLFDIQHHLSHHEVISACAEIRNILGRSVRTKLDEIVNFSSYQEKQPEAAAYARVLEEEYADTLLLADVFSNYVLLLVNNMYRMFCLRDDCPKYERKIDELRERFSPGGESSTLSELDSLCALIDLWRGGGVILDSVEADAPWLGRLVSFSRFLRLLQSESFSATKIRIFFSSQRNVSSPETLGRLIRDNLQVLSPVAGSSSILLEVFEEEPGTDFLPLIEGRIWQSESLAAVVPKHRKELGGADKDISWIVREMDYADSLSKRIVLMLENGVDLGELVADAKEVVTPLHPGTRRRLPARATPGDTFKHHASMIVYRYGQDSLRKLDGNTEAFLRKELRLVADMRAENIIRCIISFVTHDASERLALRNIHRYTSQTGLKVEDLAPRAFSGCTGKDARFKFDNLRERIRERTVRIRGEELEVVRILPGTRRHKTNFPEIISLLRPDLSRVEVEKILSEALGGNDPGEA